MGHDPQTLAAVTLVLFVAGALKGAIGIGFQAIAIPLLAMLTGVMNAILILPASLIVLNIWQVYSGGRTIVILRSIGIFTIAMCMGIWIGASIIFRIDSAGLSSLTGILSCLYAVTGLLGIPLRLPRKGEPLVTPAIGFGAGFIGAISGLFGPIVVTYLASLSLDKETFIRSTALVFLVVTTVWLIALIQSGAMTTAAMGLSAAAVIPALAGMSLGQWLRRLISEDIFRRLVLSFLFLVGLRLIWQGLS